MVLLLVLIAVAVSLVAPVWLVYRADRAQRWPARRVLRRVRAEVGSGAFRDGSVEHDELVEEHGTDVPETVRRAAYGQLWTSQWSFVLPVVTVLSLALWQGRVERWLTIAGALVLLVYSEGLRRAHAATRAWLSCDERATMQGFLWSSRLLGPATMALLLWLLSVVAKVQEGRLALMLLPMFAVLVQVSQSKEAAEKSLRALHAYEKQGSVRVRYVGERPSEHREHEVERGEGDDARERRR